MSLLFFLIPFLKWKYPFEEVGEKGAIGKRREEREES